MNFANMNKEKKQQLILGVLMAATVLFFVMNGVVKPAREEFAKARKVVLDLEPKVRNGESLTRKDQLTRRDLQARARLIIAEQRQHRPPAESRFTWALQYVTDITHGMGLQAKVEELKTPRFRPAAKAYASIAGSIPIWVPYAVDVRLVASYDEVKTLVALLQAGNPYASVSQLGIYAGGADIEKHSVTLIVEWPILRDRAEMETLRKLAGES